MIQFKKKCSIIYNPVATGLTDSIKSDIVQAVSEKGYECSLIESEFKGHVVELIELENKKSDLILTIGGDGTVSEAFRGFEGIRQKALYSHIPLGTTNDMANNFGIAKLSPKDAVYEILNGDENEIDMVKMNNSSFAYVSAWGILTSVPYRTSNKAKKRFGHAAYVSAAMPELMQKLVGLDKKLNITYEIDGKYYDEKVLLGAVSNSIGFGGVKLYKDAILNDGIFEVILVKDLNTKTVLSLFRDYLKNNIDLEKYKECFKIIKTDNIEISFNGNPPKYKADNDGEIARYNSFNLNLLNYEMGKQKLKILIPENTKGYKK